MSNDMETESAFREFHAELVGLTVEQHRRYLHVEPCDCDHPDCLGWATIPQTEHRREQRIKRRLEIAASPHFVYFAQLGNRIKIGVSINPRERARNLNATLLGTLPGDRDLERQLHEHFADLRTEGEWFLADNDLFEWIDENAEAVPA